MAKFAYNNAKNASTSHTSFELNCSYHPRVSFEENVVFRSKSRFANKRVRELRELIEVCCQNLLHTRELQKRANDKGIKSCSYAPDKKIWLNRKYIKTKKNKKLKSKIFGPFRVFHVVGKQVYKLELSMKWKIYNIFYMSLLEQDTIRKERVDNKAFSEPEKNFKAGDDKEYEVKTIIDSAVNGQRANKNQIPSLYYLIL